jgi:gliding motility-associated lipoprotein GldH
MMKTIKSLLVLLSVILLFSCTGDKHFEQAHNFNEATWHRFDILSFDLPIKNTTNEHTIQAIIRHTDKLEHDRIPLHFIMTFPSGEERIWEQTLVIRDRDGNLQGVWKDGLYEVVVPVRTRMRFREAGNCNITVEQIIPKYDTQGIASFGLKLILN